MSLTTSTSRRLLYGLSALIVLYSSFGFLVGSGILGDEDNWYESTIATIVYEVIPMLSGMVLVAGLVVHRTNPRRGLPLIIAGVIGPAVWFWMLPIYGLVMIAATALAVSITPRKQARLADA